MTRLFAVCLCLIAITGTNISGKTVADKSADENQTERKVAGTINGEPFFQEDLNVYIAEFRAAVAAYYGQKYHLSGIEAGFWDTRFDGSTPREFLNRLALENLARNMTMIREARARGIDTPHTYSELEDERAAWNAPTDEIVFGPQTLAPAEYNSYRLTGISDALKTSLLQNELAPSPEQLAEAFESLPQEYKVSHEEEGAYYTFEEAPAFGRNKWINDKFEEFLDKKVGEADILLFAATEITYSTAPIDLSGYNTVAEEQGNGTLKSRGKAAAGAATYYVDYNNGNDANDGTTPLQAWKTLNKVNLKIFSPGDHILLEANSIWNGTPADKNNYIAQAQQRGNGGMLAPQGSGTATNLCVIDLYEIKETGNGLTVYWSANRRPVINGNGTPYFDSENPYRMSGTIQLEGQDYWEIRNIEATNSYDFPKIAADPSLLHTHWYKREVPKSLVAVLMASASSHDKCKGILIENCYLHDVQSLHSNNRAASFSDWYKSDHFGSVITGNPGKNGGGIMGGFDESTIQGNIIRRVGLEGFHSSQRTPGTRLIFRGNYIETVAGDGIVVSNFIDDNLVESNLVKNACAAPNLGVACYASNWTYRSKNVLYQYNEGWGTLYGYWDGEAWDVDDYCDQVIYQYNYSHHNAGGSILFMNNQTNSIFRYNISANDGGGSRYMNTIVSPGTQAIDTETLAYKFWPKGQSLIHYSISDTIGSPTIPLVHNNTFFLGDGLSASVYGCVWDWPDKYIRFYNNIILKTGAGEVRLSDSHKANDQPIDIKNFKNPEGFRNNLLYAYQTDRRQGDKSKFLTGNLTMDQWVTGYGNIWADPMLKIQETGGETALRQQRDDPFPETDYASSDKLKDYVSVNRLRMRASLFTPLEGSPAIGAGMKIPTGNAVRELDGAWNGNYGALSGHPVHWNNSTGLTMDMFGNPINAEKPPVGGAVKAYPQ